VGQSQGLAEFGSVNLNGVVLVRSEKVHLDEIAVTVDRHR
jgi:hypothetical protein